MATKTRKRRKNAFKRYMTPFGLRQICDIIMLLAALTLIVGLIIYSTTDIVLMIGLGMMILGSLLAIIRSTRVLTSGINKRAPEFKSAITNTIIMAVICAIAILGLIFAILS